MKITLGTYKDKGEELVTFLEPRVGVKPTLSGGAVEIDDEKLRKGVKPRHVKTYIKRFLFMNEVREKYRVFVSGKELTLQEIELGKKEKEEEKEAKEPEKAKEEEKEAPAAEPEAKKAKKPAARKSRSKKKTDSED